MRGPAFCAMILTQRYDQTQNSDNMVKPVSDVLFDRGYRLTLRLRKSEDADLAAKQVFEESWRMEGSDMDIRNLRTGLGMDVHAFAEGRKLILGGVDIPHYQGLDGHSDADVLAHAISDALLGAVRGGDIGKLFPDTDPAYKDADSLKLLAEVARFVRERGFEIIDVDSVIAAQAPKLSPYREAMRENLAAAMGLPVENVGVKATTTEHLGPEGREEGITAYATCLVYREG